MLLRYLPPERAIRRDDSQSAFGVVPNFRKFRIFLDAKSLKRSAAATFVKYYANEDVVFVRTNSPKVPVAVRVDVSDPKGGVVSVEHPDGRPEWMSVAWWRTMIPWLEKKVRRRHQDEARERLPLLMYAQKGGFDLFVSECPGLASFWNRSTKTPYVASPREALATLGLYLRLRENYKYRTHPTGTFDMGRLGYSWLASEILVPSSGRTGDRFLSFITRISRILYARDRIHRCYFDLTRGALDGEAFFYLDTLLVSLVAAFDLLARIAHEALGLKDQLTVSWKVKSDWLKHLRKANPSLAALVREGSKGRAVVDLCYVLRNHIHSDPLQGVQFSTPSRDLGTHLQLPKQHRKQLSEAMTTLGGNWGVFNPDDDFYLVNVPLLTERLVSSSAKLLELMLQRLPGKRQVSRVSVSLFPPRGRRQLVRLGRLLLGVDPKDSYQLRARKSARKRDRRSQPR